MTNDAASANGSRVTHRQGQDLLVVTDALRHGYDALALPFGQATVLEIGDNEDEVVIDGLFDIIVVDRSEFDLHWLDSVIRKALRALRQGGSVVVAFDPGGKAGSLRACRGAHLRRAPVGRAWQPERAALCVPARL
jgi:hypothetical protein